MSSPTQDRQIRVFISSTFRDMQAERDYLVKFIFPQLRKLCEARGVTWGEVDLRWGVTDEQAAEGKVLPICLEEIKRCRPYFIGLLGERYGWIPETLPTDLVEREEWLKEHLHGKTSVTELEIIHGVLRNPKMAGHAFFYFRDPEYLNIVAEKDRKDFTAENAKDAEKLFALKDRIRQSKFPVRENYPGPKELGELVLADLTKVINETWPEGSQPDPLDREAMDHEAYAQSRERVYIGRQEYFDRLDVYASGNAASSSPSPPAAGGEGRGEVGNENKPLVVLGESGSGKSALLANWVARYRLAHPDALVLQHYIGATPYSADWAAMLRRLMGEFKRRLGLQQNIPDQPDALRSAFPNWLYMAAAKGRVVLVLDALNQLEDRDGAPDLVWLPPTLPENVRLIVSTLPGRPLDEIQKRHWPTLKVELLSADERRKLIAEYLAQHAKALSAARVERIAAAPPSANPLYLRVLLDELRLVRTHEELEERIGDYLQAESPYALYEKVVARWEQDYESDSDLVGDTLSLLWAARRGLTETELLQALGKDGEPLPRAFWSPLFLAMSDALINRGGLLTFAHDFLRTAVENAYLPTEQNRQQAHLRLADYFERQPAGPRRTDELPWQLAEAKEWQRLYDLLANRAFFTDAWIRNQFDVKIQWAQIEAGSTLRMIGAYRAQIEHPETETDKDYLFFIGFLLDSTGHSEESLRLHSELIKHFRKNGNLDSLSAALGNQALIARARGDLDGAIVLLQEQQQICRQLGNLDGLSGSVVNQSLILYAHGDLDGAMARFKEAERIFRQLGNMQGLSIALGNQALILQDRGDLNGAMVLHKEQEGISNQTGNLDVKVLSLSGQALILQRCGNLKEARLLHKKVEHICRQLGDLNGLNRAIGNQGLISKDCGEVDQAMALFKETEQISRQLCDKDSLATTFGNQALILQMRGDLDGATGKLKEQERICLEIGNLRGLSIALCNQAAILQVRGDLDAAMEMHKKVEQVFRQLENLDGLSTTLANQAGILKMRGELDGAMALQKEAEQICRQLGKIEGIAVSLANQASIWVDMGWPQKAIPYLEEACRFASKHGFVGLVEQFTPFLKSVQESICDNMPSENAVLPPSLPAESPAPPHKLAIPQLRDSAATALKRGLWEAAETYLEKLLQQGEPVETVAPDLITALLNAHETVLPHTLKRVEALLAQLESAGHAAIAAPLRQQLQSKLPRKKGWKFW